MSVKMSSGKSEKVSTILTSSGSLKNGVSVKSSPVLKPSTVSSKSTKISTITMSCKSTKQPTLKIDDVTESLLIACKAGDITAVQTLVLDSNTVINGQDEDLENSALHYAAFHGHDEIVELLLKSGAMVDVENEVMETPLMVASRAGHFSIVKALLSAGACMDHLNEDGQNALKVAKTNKIKELINMLKSNEI